MRVVITGGLGFIGQNVASYLKKMHDGWRIAAIDWDPHPVEGASSGFDEVHQVDFTDQRAWPVYDGADVVVHLAAYTTVQESIKDPVRSLDNNVAKSLALIDHLRLRSPETLMVFASTGGAIIGDHNGPISEGLAPRPLSPYGASKAAIESVLSGYGGSFGMRSASLRFSNIYGPRSYRKGSLIAAFCKRVVADLPLTINGDGEQTRDYLYVDDVCQAIDKVIDQSATGVFQLGTGVPTSVNEVVSVIQSLLPPGRELDVRYGQALPGEVRHNVADIGHAREQLGFSPQTDLPTGIGETLRWFQQAELLNKVGVA